ncbi:hypothetical protein [Candidatus Methylomirabilis sp.]|uniref:hypothetical protein n=1 Tax=Candidatus Methylomirabilis sp. TaxID=2032687 RepID=UPI003C745628
MVDEKKTEKKGFAGLDHLVSDVEPVNATPAPAPTIESERTGQSETPQETVRPIHFGAPQAISRSFGKYWAIGVGVLVLFIWISNNDSNKSVSTRSVSVAPSPVPTYEPAPAHVVPAPAYVAPGPINAPVPVGNEELPPIGNGLTFNESQMRYCLSEEIRVTIWKDYVDNYSETSVDAFNTAINDYNARCSHFRYRRGSLERVRAQVEANRDILERQGLDKASENP